MKIPGTLAPAAGLAVALTAMSPAPAMAAENGGGALFSVDPGLALWTIIVFLLVLWVLKRFAWGPILGALEAREAGIRKSIDGAASMRAEAESLLEEHRRQLADARRQAQEIVAEGRNAAERIGREVQEKARQEGERIVERARAEIEREKDAALAELRRESVDLALAAASRLLRERLDDDRDRALVKGFLAELETPAAEA
jgi:F-type H+-transporting ATPase subunit b